MDERFFYYLAGIPLLGMLAQWVAWWTRLPSILLLLGFGIVLGQVLNPDELLSSLTQTHAAETHGESASPGLTVEQQAQIASAMVFPFVSLAVAVILFEGGLSLRFTELRESGGAVLRLVTIGAAISWILISLAAWLILKLDGRIAVLLGAILIVTGPTVVIPMMRYIRPTRRIESIIKWEGIVIDPIGAVLAVLVFESLFIAASHESRPVLSFLMTAVVGTGVGLILAKLITEVVRRYWIPDYLHGLFFLSSAIAGFALCNFMIKESGLVTVTAMGIALANQKQISIDHVIEFKENLGVFLVSCLFIVLGSRLDLAELWALGVPGLIFLATLIFLVRPISVFASTWRTDSTVRERWFISFLAPRGIVAAAVSSVFALELIAFLASEQTAFADVVPDARKMIPVTFLVIVGSVAFYGITAAPLARRLELADKDPQGILIAGADDWIRDLAKLLDELGVAVTLVDTNYSNVAAAKMAGLRAACLSVLSEQVHEEADLSGIGRFMALTSNDAVNAMGCDEYAHMFGRRNVYRLVPGDLTSGKRATLQHHPLGRELFTKEWTEERFWSEYRSGFRFKTTKLTEEYTLEDFSKTYGEETLVLMVLDANNKLQINTVEEKFEPKPGHTLVALVRIDE